jgi:FtsZ-interacting cell division protein ZipA
MFLYVTLFSLLLGVSLSAFMASKSRKKREAEILRLELLWKKKIPQVIEEHSSDNKLQPRPINNSKFRLSLSKGTMFGRKRLPAINKNGLPSLQQNNDQLALFSKNASVTSINEPAEKSEAGTLVRAEDYSSRKKPKGLLIQLYIKRRSGELIDGPALVRSFNKVGLTFGEMSVFHFINHTQPEGPPLFSAADMHEPGTFDMGRVEILKTQGVVFFMNAFEKTEGEKDFHLMVSAGKRMAELIKADLYSSPDVEWIEAHEKEALTMLEKINSG